MRHLVDHRKLGRTASHRRALMRNMVTSLILKERIETTLPKAKELRRWGDRMITLAKQGDLAARRRAASILLSRDALEKLFDGFGKRFADRAGGYTRLIHYGWRRGDGAPMAAVEYLGYLLPALKKQDEKKEKKQEVKKAAKKAAKVVEQKTAEKKQRIAKKTTDAPAKKRWGLFGKKTQGGE